MSVSTGSGTPLRYRSHIDGLRGISIIAMIFFHAKFFGITGGYIGVDIFFVISGFLITSIIVRDIKEERFSLISFWERRIRRIIPALFVVVCATAVGAYFFILYPADFHHFGNAVIAQSMFASNILFMLTDNYFDQTSRYSALLHTWTLSLEEQFYFVFPFLVLICAYFAKKLLTGADADSARRKVLFSAVCVLSVLSFAFSVFLTNIHPSHPFSIPFVKQGIFWQTSYATAGFYLLLTRAWEIGLGILLAVTSFKIRSKFLAQLLASVGLAMIILPIFLLTDGMPYPGFAALWPTLGTLFIIEANEEHQTYVGRMLSIPFFVGVGLISYPLYLWYWPIFVFTDVFTLLHPTVLQHIVAIALAILLAMLTYRYIETPIRKKKIFSSQKSAYVFGISAIVVMALTGLAIRKVSFSETHTSRLPHAAQEIIKVANATENKEDECFTLPHDVGQNMCRIGSKAAKIKPSFVVWGDSHADAFRPVLASLGRTYGLQGVVFNAGACIPLLGVHQSPPADGCEDLKKQAISFMEDNDISYIFLVSRWSYYVMGGPDAARVAFITDSSQITTSPEQAQKVFERNLVKMVSDLVQDGRHVIIVDQVPEQSNFVTRAAFYTAIKEGSNFAIKLTTSRENAEYQKYAKEVIDALTGIPQVTVVDPTPFFCTATLCNLQQNGEYLYKDGNHLNTIGAMSLMPLFDPIFERMNGTKR